MAPADLRRDHYLRDLFFIGHPPDRNPVAVSICLCLAIVLWPTAVGIRALPGSLANAPDSFGMGCAIAITLGCIAKVIGNLLPRRDAGLPFELMGSFILAAGCAFYAAAVVIASGMTNGALPFGMGVGLGIGAVLRGTQIILYVRGRVAINKEP